MAATGIPVFVAVSNNAANLLQRFRTATYTLYHQQQHQRSHSSSSSSSQNETRYRAHLLTGLSVSAAVLATLLAHQPSAHCMPLILPPTTTTHEQEYQQRVEKKQPIEEQIEGQQRLLVLPSAPARHSSLTISLLPFSISSSYPSGDDSDSSHPLLQLTGGFVSGFVLCTGIRWFTSTAIAGIGVGTIILIGLHQTGYVHIEWEKLKQKLTSAYQQSKPVAQELLKEVVQVAGDRIERITEAAQAAATAAEVASSQAASEGHEGVTALTDVATAAIQAASHPPQPQLNDEERKKRAAADEKWERWMRMGETVLRTVIFTAPCIGFTVGLIVAIRR